MDKVKRLLGIKKDKKEKKTGGAAAAPQPAPLAVNMEDLAGSKKASHGVGGSAASHKAHGGHHHHHAHDAFQSKSASKGVGSSSSMIANGDLGSMGSMAASEIVGVPAEPDRTNATDQAWRQEAQIPSAKPAKRSEVAAKGGFVNPDGTRLTQDDVNMMKLMLAQVLESYPARIENEYNPAAIKLELELKNHKGYNRFLKNYKKHPEMFTEGDRIEYLGKGKYKLSYEDRIKEAKIDSNARSVLLNTVKNRAKSLSGEIDAIQRMPKATSASEFLEEYMKNTLSYFEKTGKLTQRNQRLLSTTGVSDFTNTLNAAFTAFEYQKDDELEGIESIGEYDNANAKKMAGGRMQGSSTLNTELEKLFNQNAKFRLAINMNAFLCKKNGDKQFDDVKTFLELVQKDNDVANKVLEIIEKEKLKDSAKSIGNFNKAAGIASEHAQALKGKSTITFSDLMNTFMAINIGVGEKGESDDGKLQAKSHGTSSGSISGPAGDTISADLFILFAQTAKTMNEIKSIQITQPNIAKSRAIKLAGIVNSITISAHAFVNGNGRTCRLLADAILECFDLPPASVNETMTGVGGKFGELYAKDEMEADPTKDSDFDRSTKGYLAGVKESDRLLQSK